MGTKLKEIVTRKEIEISYLKDKRLVVDSFNVMYQFLTTIRLRDGSLLMDSRGNVTSHLNGLFHRTINLTQKGLKLAFVFDGEPPKLKMKERQRRRELKEEAAKRYEEAKAKEDLEEMKKYAARTSVLTKDMIEEAKKLVDALGMPVIQAPSEGEAQAAHMVKRGEAYAEVSQDFDCLMFGVPRLVRNLTVSERRKLPGKQSFQVVKPEMIELQEMLKALDITHDQLIVICMLIGTDYNKDGIKGIGPKNALKIVRKESNDFDRIFKKVEWDQHFDVPWTEIFGLVKNMPVTDDYRMEWAKPDGDRIMKLLVDDHDFSEKMVRDSLAKLEKDKEMKSQKGLGQFFK